MGERRTRMREQGGPGTWPDSARRRRDPRMSDAFFSGLARHFRELEQPLNALDAAIGDGDHGAAMRRGLEAVAEAEPGAAAQAFRGAAGGASGALFGELIDGIEAALEGRQDLPSALERTAARIARVGMAKRGDKTMLDALIPAAEAARAVQGSDTARAAAEAAREGAASTAAMTARRGRARYVENGGVGHRDAGARSVAEILAVYERFSREHR